MPFKLLVLIVLAWFTFGCQAERNSNPTPPPELGFYHWTQQLQPDSLPLHLLEQQADPELFVRCFDVVWQANQPKAVSIVSLPEGRPLPFRPVPVVFVTNQVMLKLDDARRGQLIDDLIALIEAIFGLQSSWELGQAQGEDSLQPPGFFIQELQIDCDWTAGSRNNYFAFLEALKAQLPKSVQLSATIRLHQFRDRKAQGIPPVDRGVLMAYNVGDLDYWATPNSILDSTLTVPYLTNKGQGDYPVPLDLALPHYQWAAIYRDDRLVYLINELSAAELGDTSRFAPLNPHRYFVNQTTYLNGYLLYPGDRIRLEKPDQATLLAVARQLAVVPTFPGQRLLFYRIGGRLTAASSLSSFREIAAEIR
jgi:hypothetical protein